MTKDIEKVIQSIGAEWKDRYYNREWFIAYKHGEIDAHLPELKRGGKKVLDVSCGTGVTIEILKHYGNDCMGLDIRNSVFRRTLRTQGIDYVEHDCSRIPYPLKDKSFDYIINVGAIEQYGLEWRDVINEFMRIARECVFVIPNQGKDMERYRQSINTYEPDGWVLKTQNDQYKWLACG